MLVGLDDIEWSTLSHAYGNAENIPQMLRDMETADDKKFWDIFDDFSNQVNHQATLYEVTPFVIPFLIQLIKLSNHERRKGHYLGFLAHLAESSERPPRYGSQVEQYRQSYQIYDALEQASPYFFALSSHDDPDIKVLSLYILSYMSSLQPQVTSLLKQAFESSHDTFIQMVMICGYERSLSSAPLSDDYEAGLQQLIEWSVSDRSFLTRLTACLNYISLSRYAPERLLALSDAMRDLLVHSFEIDIFEIIDKTSDESAFYYPRAFMALVPFVSNMSLIDDNHTLLWLLVVEKSKMTPEVSFISVRKLLRGVFSIFEIAEEGAPSFVFIEKTYSPMLDGRKEHPHSTVTYEHTVETRWDSQDEFFHFFKGNHYRVVSMRGLAHHTPSEPFTNLQRQALEAVLACDSFLASGDKFAVVLYGLPDDREQLRALLGPS